MKVAVMQPYFFPYIGYWQLISCVDKFVIFDDVNFIKKGFINRNSLLLNGEPYRFTLSLLKASQNKKINEILIGDNKLEILDKIQKAYAKSKSFSRCIELFEQILQNQENNLALFLGHSIVKLSEFIGIETDIIYSSDLDIKHGLKGQERIIEICDKLDGNCYINAIGGRSLYNANDFSARGIELRFLDSHLTSYEQHGVDKFTPYLSIIDLLMNNSENELNQILAKYSFI